MKQKKYPQYFSSEPEDFQEDAKLDCRRPTREAEGKTTVAYTLTISKTKNNMSKTIDNQIELTSNMTRAMKSRLSELEARGITREHLDNMDRQIGLLKEANNECESIRQELSRRIRKCNELLREVKDDFKMTKDIVKGYYPQEQWRSFGIKDKR